MNLNNELEHFSNLNDLLAFLDNVENFDKFNFPEIAKSQTNLVFSKGNPKNERKVMIIGEAPGSEEEKEGKPFIGKCGKLLSKIFEEIGINENEDLYFTNSVFWRPKILKLPSSKNFSNRAPKEEEISWCKKYLYEHIRLVDPKIIITLGLTPFYALQNFDKKEKAKIKITQIRGSVHPYSQDQSVSVYPSFHPAYIMRKPEIYNALKEDLSKILKN
jgi:DNA polymerase